MLKKNVRDDRYGAPARFGSEVETDYDDGLPDEPEETLTGMAEASPASPVSAAAGSAPSARGQSIIDANSSFDGRFEAVQDMVILGSISGEVICKGVITIEREATARAKIQTRDAHILGRLEGDIVCSGKLILAASANVSGTIKAAALVVEEGARISGSVETASAPPSLDLTTSARSMAAKKPIPTAADPAPAADAAANGGPTARWTRTREVPSFALVPSDERASLEAN